MTTQKDYSNIRPTEITPLMKEAYLAIAGGDYKKVEEMLKSKTLDPNQTVWTCGEKPLTVAGRAKQLAIMKLLVNHGADINSRNDYDRTTLLQCSCPGYEEIVAFLLNNKANTEIQDNLKRTPLIAAASTNAVEIAQVLVGCGANVNHAENHGSTPLFLAICARGFGYPGYVVMARLLLTNGADYNHVCNNGNTPLICGALIGTTDIVGYILNYPNVDTKHRNHNGYNAVEMANGTGHHNIALMIEQYEKQHRTYDAPTVQAETGYTVTTDSDKMKLTIELSCPKDLEKIIGLLGKA